MIIRIFLILILIMIAQDTVFAQTQSAGIEYGVQKYYLNPADEPRYLRSAKDNFQKADYAQSRKDKIAFLQESMRNYFLITQINPQSIDAQLGIARIYDEINFDRLAKKYFYAAQNLNPKYADTNYYFGDFYYKRKDYINAMKYYNKAYIGGYSSNYDLLYKQAKIYEKLADIQTARKFYIEALNIKPDSLELADKIRLLDELNYSQSQYYLFKKN